MIKMAAGLLMKNSKLLIIKKIDLGNTVDRWELPGGRLQPGETPEQGLRRYMREKFAIEARIGEFFSENVYAYGSDDIKLVVHRINWDGDERSFSSHGESCWVGLNEIPRYDFTAAYAPIMEELYNKEYGGM